MNICTPGNCICDAREWEGDTNCMGEIDCPKCNREHKPGPCRPRLTYCQHGNDISQSCIKCIASESEFGEGEHVRVNLNQDRLKTNIHAGTRAVVIKPKWWVDHGLLYQVRLLTPEGTDMGTAWCAPESLEYEVSEDEIQTAIESIKRAQQ